MSAASRATQWQVGEDCGDSGALAVYTREGRKVALVFGREIPFGLGSNADQARKEAEVLAQSRALMIAAAPELYAALKVEHDWWLEELTNCNGEDAANRARRRLALISIALARAEAA